MPDLPSGTVTFLFTDIEGSTRLLKRLGERYVDLLDGHHRLLREAISSVGGQEIDTQGDSFFVAFRRARDAVLAAVAAQRALAEHEWPEGLEVRVRMGIHTGEPAVGGESYVGLGVHRAARICSACHGGQLLVSNATRELVQDDLPSGVGLRELGEHSLKDLDRAECLFQVTGAGLRSDFPPLRTLAGPETVALFGVVSGRPAAVAPIAATDAIVGREPELGTARAILERARSGRGAGGLLVTGDAGIGKTRLCEEILTEASRIGLTTLRGAAREAEGVVPYGPVVEALDRLLMDRADLAAGLTEGARSELARLSIALPAAATASAELPDRQRIFSAVAQLLAHAARERGAVILVDDVHLADRVTLQLLHYLARVGHLEPLVVVLAFRGVVLNGRLGELRSSLLAQRLAAEIRLGPLDRSTAAAIAARVSGGALGGEATDAIWSLAEGNPFFTEELAAAIDPRGRIEMPVRLYEVLYARLVPLRPSLRRAITRLAVAGGEFTVDDIAVLTGLGGEEALTMIDEALGGGLLREAEGRFRFRHALVRDAVVRALPSHRLAAAHREVAARLCGAANVTPARIAHHLLEGERPKDAVAWLARAAREAAQVAAYSDALDFLQVALRHAARAEREALLPLRADLLLATGDRSAPAAYREAVAVASQEHSVELRVKQARALLIAGDVDEAAGTLEGLVASSGSDAARLAVTRGLTAWFSADLEQAGRDAAEGRSLAVKLGLWQETVEATALAAAVAHTMGDWTGRVELELGETLAHPDLAQTVFDALHCTAEYVLASGQPYAPLVAAARELRATAERSAASRAQAFAATVLGEAELLIGDLDTADAQLRDAVRLNEAAGSTCGRALALLRHAEVTAALGGQAEASELLDEALALARWSPLANHLLYLVYGVMLRVSSEPARSLAVLDQADMSLEEYRGCAFCAAGFHVAATMACAAAGDLARARQFLELAERGARLWTGGPQSAAVAEARGRVSLADGTPEDARRHLHRAAEGFADAGQVLNEARARAWLATVG